MIGVHVGIGGRRRVTGGGGGGAPGAAPSGFAALPTVHYHPASQAATLDAQGRVLGCPDIRGLAPLSGLSFAGATVGPKQMTDGLGRRFWRFENAPGGSSSTAYLLVANTLNGLSARGMTVLAMVRHHRATSLNVFSPRYAAYTDDAANTTYSGGSTLRSVVTSNSAPILSGAAVSAASARHVTGAQLQLMGVASRATANGGQRLYLNNEVAAVAQSGVVSANCTGGIVGGIPAASNAVTPSGFMDLYELAIWKGELTNAQADAAAAAMVSNWAIPAVANSLLLEGDSITQGTGDVVSGINIAMRMTEPGGAFTIPAGWRVINQGASGNTAATILARRDAANSAAALPAPGGRNIVAVQIGRNDLAAARTGAQIYADCVALFNTATTGFLQRGWETAQAVNIASAPSFDPEIQALRSALRNLAQFRSDTQTGAGQAFDGKLSIIDLPLWTVLGDRIFDTTADAADAAWYAGDSTHPGIAGAVEMAKAYRAGMTLG
jgi:lysophospholipase L1-like esterase